MAKKLTAQDWNTIQKERPARYYVQSVEDGAVTIIFDSELMIVDKGEQDLIGRPWTKDWKKTEALVRVNGIPKLYSLGSVDWSFLSDLIAVCKANDISPENIVGCMFEIKKLSPFQQEIKYLGKEGEKDSGNEEKKQSLVKEIKSVIDDLKLHSMDLIRDGQPKSDFLKICSIKGHLKVTQIESVLKDLESLGYIKLSGDKVIIQ